ncbi:MAG TPA: hypothetical protein VFU76_14570 [Terriglobales bacterium]|nr:hypothetical protein [Terriglobales bacterium]
MKLRRTCSTLLAVLAAVLLPPACVAQTTAAIPSGMAQQVANELASLDSSMTPVAWLQAHPAEKLEVFSGRQPENDTEKWCARAVARHTDSSGISWIRSAYFYEPEAPADDILPPAGTAPGDVLAHGCRLGLIWIEAPETDVAKGVALTQAITAALTARFGAAESPKMPGGFGSAGWVETRQWKVKDAIITSAYDQFGGKGHRALVRMAFPNSDAVHDVRAEIEQDRVEHRATLDALLGRVSQAGLPAEATDEMAALLTEPDYFSARNLPPDTQVVSTFRDWIAAAKSKSPGQQAAALLAGDSILDFLDHNGVQMGDQVRTEMAQLHANYVMNQLAGGPVYAHGLLQAAKAVAPPGPAQDAILLAEMERGFDETGMCSAGAEEFAEVIAKGEALLAGARALPAETLAALHFMVADAYTTIVWLATTADTEYHDPKTYAPQADSARAKALEHYRAALKLEHGTARSHAAWREAWRLAAGLAPTSGRYFCIYD